MNLVNHNYLFELGVVADIALIVNATSMVSGATHAPSSPCNEDDLHAISGRLFVYIALNQGDTPMFLNILGNESFAYAIVPHVPCVTLVPTNIFATALSLPRPC